MIKYIEFVDALKLDFNSNISEDEAQTQLFSMAQGDQSVLLYSQRFLSLAQLTKSTKKDICFLFHKRLSTSVRALLSKDYSQNCLESLITQAISA